MIETQILLIKIVRALVEVAGLSLIGQAIVGIFAGAARDRNPIYQLFKIVTRPVISGLRIVTPRIILDRHLPFVAFFLLFWLWIFLAKLRIVLCQTNGLVC